MPGRVSFAFYLCLATPLARCKPLNVDSCDKPSEVKNQTAITYDWHGGSKAEKRNHVIHHEVEHGTCDLRSLFRDRKARGVKPKVGGPDLVAPVWDRITSRNAQYELVAKNGEHPCFAGYESMIRDTDRCQGFTRLYPDIGGEVVFVNRAIGAPQPFKLETVVSDFINVWVGPGSTDLQRFQAVQAMQVYANVNNSALLSPSTEGGSWVERTCNVFGQMPFMWTCSNRINVLFMHCGFVNAFVSFGDFLANFPLPADSQSGPNHDNIFYMCWELVDYFAGNIPFVADVAAHESAHLVQGGFGFSFTAITEGAATWLEGALISQAPRPLYWLSPFEDWNALNAAHIYASLFGKFYQFHGLFLTYLMQEGVLGLGHTAALQLYRPFVDTPFGRGTYDYYLSFMGKDVPTEFSPIELDVGSTYFPMAEAMLNWRVAIVAACIVDDCRRPKDPRYLLPEHLRDRPYWDCSTYPTYWSHEQASVRRAAIEMEYGGAAVYRLAMPQHATISIADDADPKVRTKVLAAGDGKLHAAKVVELRPGESVTFKGDAREIFVVQVNVDPEGEMLSQQDMDPVWHLTDCNSSDGKCWFAGDPNGANYPPSSVRGLRSPVAVAAEVGVNLTFIAKWQMEPEFADGTTVRPGCPIKGFDGVQVRVFSDDEEFTVVRPAGGYGAGPGGETALYAFLSEGVYDATAPCSDFDGWTGTSSVFKKFNVALDAFAGEHLRFEFLFASDASLEGPGFWVGDIKVVGEGGTIYDEAAGDAAMVPYVYTPAPPAAGSIRPFSGVPVVAGYPKGYVPDVAFVKRTVTRKSPWSAEWSTGAPLSKLQRTYVGWSYGARVFSRAMLHPGQEACVRLQAPFHGAPQTATLFALRTKIGVTSVTLTMRTPHFPFTPRWVPWQSSSSPILDPSTHRFNLENSGPILRKDEEFLLCVGVIAKLDIDLFQHYLELPLTYLGAAAGADGPGRTFLLMPLTGSASEADPWGGYSLALRAEFVQRPCPEWELKNSVEPVAAAAPEQERMWGSQAVGLTVAAVAGSLLALAWARVLLVAARPGSQRAGEAEELLVAEEGPALE